MEQSKPVISLEGRALISFDAWRKMNQLFEDKQITFLESLAEKRIDQDGEDAWISEQDVMNHWTETILKR